METQKIDIAVVILSWNGIEWIKTFLPTIIDKSSNANIYVADNASTDGTVDYIKENFTNVNVIQNYSNDGYAKGYNDALKNLNEKYFVLINSDIEVTDNWLNPIIDLMEDNLDIAACQPKILDYNIISNKYFFLTISKICILSSTNLLLIFIFGRLSSGQTFSHGA